MNNLLINSLHYRKYPELEPYFNSEPFNSIIISTVDKRATMLDNGYIANLTIKFWRLLQISKLLATKKGDTDYCDFLLEVFLNQALSCTDTLATTLNHFLQLQLSGQKLAVQNEGFIIKLKQTISGFQDIEKIDSANTWVRDKLYPYRNIVHHMGESSGYVQMTNDNLSVECCLTLKEDEWDFVTMRQDLKTYPSHTAFLIASNTINLPNIITGATGDAHKYIRIDDFFDVWTNKIFDLIKTFISAQVWCQKNLKP